MPLSLFTYVDVHGTPKDLYATVEDVAVVKLTGNLAVPRVNSKRATFNSCSPTAQSQLNTAATSAQTLAFNAYAYAMAISSGTYWYTRWFGAYDSSRLNTVRSHFELIVGHDFSTFTYDCSCTRSDWFTYIGPYIFQLWDCYLVTDRSLDQNPTSLERSGSALASGVPPTPVPIPRPEHSSVRLSTGPRAVVPSTTLMVSLLPWRWLEKTHLKPS